MALGNQLLGLFALNESSVGEPHTGCVGKTLVIGQDMVVANTKWLGTG